MRNGVQRRIEHEMRDAFALVECGIPCNHGIGAKRRATAVAKALVRRAVKERPIRIEVRKRAGIVTKPRNRCRCVPELGSDDQGALYSTTEGRQRFPDFLQTTFGNKAVIVIVYVQTKAPVIWQGDWTHDDLMNCYRAFQSTWKQLWIDIVCFWQPTPLFRPVGELFYKVMFDQLGMTWKPGN